MLYPSINKIRKKADSRYTLVILAAKRARDLIDGKPALAEDSVARPVSIAAHEIAEDLITYDRDGNAARARAFAEADALAEADELAGVEELAEGEESAEDEEVAASDAEAAPEAEGAEEAAEEAEESEETEGVQDPEEAL